MDFDFNKKEEEQNAHVEKGSQGGQPVQPQDAGHEQAEPQPSPWQAPQDVQSEPQQPAGYVPQGEAPSSAWPRQETPAAGQPSEYANYEQWQRAAGEQKKDARTAYDSPQSGWNIEPGTEPRTPYQTPVRQYATYEEWQRGQSQQGAPRPTGESAGPNAYSTYEEWQRQQQAKEAAVGEQKPKKSHKRLAITLGGVAAACLLLAAGVGIGSQFGGSTGGSQSTISGVSPVDPSKPAVTVTDSPSTTGTGIDDGLTGEQIYDKVSPSVVSVVSSSLTSQEQSSGSGVIMSADGYIITNHHVIDGAQKVTIITADKIQYNAEIVGSDEATDLAVLRITDAGGAKFTPAEFGNSTQIKAGQRAYAIGSPGGVELANTITSGSISAISRDITIDDRVMTLIQTDASINPGNSGGALINPYGQVIGITSAKLGISYYEGLGFAIPVDTAQEIVDNLIQYGYVPGRPAIGISGSNLTKEVASYNNVPQGVLVHAVDARSSAAQVGLQVNDIITAVNGKTITTMDEVNEAKGDLKAGDKMTLTIYRISTGKSMDLTITLSDEHDLKEESAATEQPQWPTDGSGNGGSQNGGYGSYFFPW